jgi:glycosyltransferase involved in cell wall biosynthesis
MIVPSISVIIPLYNKEKDVSRALSSVLAQTMSDFEIVVVNDGSTDKGPDLVRAMKDPRIKVVDQANSGVTAARNRGIAEARAELIAFLDADDEWEPDFLETIMHLKNKFPSCEVCATNYSFRRANNYSRPTIERGLPNEFREGILTDYFKIASQSDPPLWTSAVAVTKNAIEAIGGFPTGVTIGEDLLTWARLALQYDIAYCIAAKAYHWEPVNIAERPGRFPQIPDVVGQELALLLHNSERGRIKGLRKYLAVWHRMRASIFIRLGRKFQAALEIKRAILYFPFNVKLIIYIFLLFIPTKIANNLIKFRRIF